VVFGQVSPYLTLPAGTYDLKITAPGGYPTLIDPMPVTLSSNSIQSVFATGDVSHQPLGAFAWPSNQPGFFLPLTRFIYLPPKTRAAGKCPKRPDPGEGARRTGAGVAQRGVPKVTRAT